MDDDAGTEQVIALDAAPKQAELTALQAQIDQLQAQKRDSGPGPKVSDRGHCGHQVVPESADNELEFALRQARADLDRIRSELPAGARTPPDHSSVPVEPRACCSDRQPDRSAAPAED